MNEAMRGRAIEGLLLMLGLILGGWILGSQIKATRLADRYVTVKGLVERNVKSDLAIWPISFKESGANLQTVLDQSEKDKGSVLAFLKSQDSRLRKFPWATSVLQTDRSTSTTVTL
jgi:uncharacterized protein